MNRKLYMFFLLLAMIIGFFAESTLMDYSRSQATGLQATADVDKVLVHGYGKAKSAEAPPGEQFTLIASNGPDRSFKVVPPGKTFVLTDMVYNARGVNQNLTVNLARGKLTPDRLDTPFTADILLQVYIKPGEATETHLCTGYVIPSGHSVMAWTNAGLEPGQWVQVAVTGYLIDQKKP